MSQKKGSYILRARPFTIDLSNKYKINYESKMWVYWPGPGSDKLGAQVFRQVSEAVKTRNKLNETAGVKIWEVIKIA